MGGEAHELEVVELGDDRPAIDIFQLEVNALADTETRHHAGVFQPKARRCRRPTERRNSRVRDRDGARLGINCANDAFTGYSVRRRHMAFMGLRDGRDEDSAQKGRDHGGHQGALHFQVSFY